MNVHEYWNNFQNEQQIGWEDSPVIKTLFSSVMKTQGGTGEGTNRIVKQIRKYRSIPLVYVIEKGDITYQ